MASILPERDPLTHMERKVWEFALCALFLEEVGALHEDARVLAVGAGDERLVFWLANHVGEVVATDIYGDGEFAEAEAGASMLTAPPRMRPSPTGRSVSPSVGWTCAGSTSTTGPSTP